MTFSKTLLLSGLTRLAKPLQLKKDYQREILSLFFLAMSSFMVLSLINFSFTDPSLFSFSYPEAALKNPGGKLGAHFSGAAFYWLGFASFFIPIINLFVIFFLLKGTQTGRIIIFLLCFFVINLCLACFLDQTLNQINYQGFQIFSGGWLGNSLSSSLREWTGQLGSIIFLITISLSAFLVILRKALIIPSFKKTAGFLKNSRFFRRSPEVKDSLLTQKQPADIPISFEKSSQHVENEEKKEIKERLSLKPLSKLSPFIKHTHKQNPHADHYTPPPLKVLEITDKKSDHSLSKSEIDKTASLLVQTLSEFGINGDVIGYQPGPVVTVYEFQPQAGIKQSKIISLIDDLALALHADSIFIHPVKGKRALGIQVPNQKRSLVRLGDIISSRAFVSSNSPLTFAMGKSLSGEPVCTNLQTMPHLLVAGATGSGKSVGINSLLCSIIMKASPKEVRLILVDPKMLELSVYDGIPHLLMPVITEPAKATIALKWAVNEMERRYKIMQKVAVRNIIGFNEYWKKLDDEKKQELRSKLEEEDLNELPFIVFIIDELADLMLTAPKETESMIQRLAQKARASGIHMVLATQRPSVDIITGVIKANLPSRIAFQVVAKHDSRTILDQMGAEKLLGKGDLLFQKPGQNQLERIQGAFVSDEEVVGLVAEAKAQDTLNYDDRVINWIDEEASRADSDSLEASSSDDVDLDSKWDEAISIGQTHGVVSASFLQRHLKIGYNRAARIVDMMEKQSLVAKADGSKPRKWLGPSSV